MTISITLAWMSWSSVRPHTTANLAGPPRRYALLHELAGVDEQARADAFLQTLTDEITNLLAE